MWSNNKQTNGKSPYRTRQSTWRARGIAIWVTAAFVFVGAVAWIFAYTSALQTTAPVVQTVDPAAVGGR